MRFEQNNLGVTTGNDKGKNGKLNVLGLLIFLVFLVQEIGVDVAFDVVNGNEGNVLGKGVGASGKSADHQGADETGFGGDSDGVNVIPADFFHGLVDDGVDDFEVAASSDFGNYAAELFVDFDLRCDNVGQDF